MLALAGRQASALRHALPAAALGLAQLQQERGMKLFEVRSSVACVQEPARQQRRCRRPHVR